MRKMLSVLFLTMTISLHAQSGIGALGVRAEWWNKSNSSDKIVYVIGLFDGLAFSDFKIWEGEKISTNLSIVQYVHAIDEIYSDYRNSLIPVPFVLQIITMEVNGMPKEKIEAKIERYRSFFKE